MLHSNRYLPRHGKAATPRLLAVLGFWVLINFATTCAQGTGDFPTLVDSVAEGTLVAKSGEPYGVGQIEIPLDVAIKSGWNTDQAIRLSSEEGAIWLPARSQFVVMEPLNLEADNDANQSKKFLRIHFLFSGDVPSAVKVHFAGNETPTVSAANSDPSQADLTKGELTRRWWEAIHQQEEGNSPAVRELTNDFLATIGAHLGRSPKPQQATTKAPDSELEKQFERTLGMLLGFESVRLSMMVDKNDKAVDASPAIHSLPVAINVAGQRIPNGEFNANKIEPIASMVPNDCFYLRCGSINNYLWLRRFLIGWGGSLDDIITNPSLTSDVRARIEDQLGISTTASLDADAFVSDLAIIGSDVFFAEGAGIGILFEAIVGDEQKLETILQQQRLEKAKQFGASQYSVSVANHDVSIYRTDDNRMRSFLVRHGRYVLVTNSKAMLTAIVSPDAAARSLANLKEYRYALATNQAFAQAGISLYLSDPFIRRLTSPAYRIELGRRRSSAEECRQLEVAAMVASALGKPADSKQILINGNFLTRGFGVQPDGSQVELKSEGAFDSLRGKPGTFIPAADVSTTKANWSEISAYSDFSRRYRAEWPAMDPVLVTIASKQLNDSVDQVKLQIHITPYARNEYQFLTNYLAQPTQTHATLTQGELMGISAHLRTHSRNILAHLGISDVEVPFIIQEGELLRTDGNQRSFTKQQSFAAVTPGGVEGLQSIGGLMQSLQDRKPHDVPTSAASSSRSSSNSRPLFGFNLFGSGRIPSATEMLFASSELVVRSLFDVSKLSSIEEDQQWSVYGGDSTLRKQIRQNLAVQEVAAPSQLFLHAGGIDQAAIAPYLNAYSYCQSRKLSAAVTSWLDRWSTGLRTDPEFFRTNVQQTLHGELTCPLGGNLELAKPAMVWRSTKWEEDSLASVNHVPDSYQFPFLQWLKGVELRFNLETASLNSDVLLQVARTKDDNFTPIVLRSLAERVDDEQAVTQPERTVAPETARRATTIPTAPKLSVKLSTKVPEGLTNATFSSNGERLLTAGFGRTAHLFDTKNLKTHQVLIGHQKTIWTLALSRDGKTAVTGSEDQTLRFWNTSTGKEVAKIEAGGIFSCVRFSPDGTSVFATNWDGKVRIIDVRNPKIVTTVDCGQSTLDVSILADGIHFLTGTPSGEILHFNSATGQLVRKFVGHEGTVHSLAIFSDSTRFLSASHDRTLRLWDLSTGAVINVYRGHTQAVHEVRLAPNQNQFVSSSADGTVRVWNVTGSTPPTSSPIGNDVRGISLSSDGRSLAAVCTDGTMQILALDSR